MLKVVIIINTSKSIIKVVSIIFIIALFTKGTDAYSTNITNDITIDKTFTCEDGPWMSGRLESKDFYIHNNKESDIRVDRLYITLKSSEYYKTGEKVDIYSRKFKEFAEHTNFLLKHGKDILFEDKLKNILTKDGIKLNKDIYIKSNSKELLNMTIDMDLEMNNDAQALNNVFTIAVAYKINDNKIQSGNEEELIYTEYDNTPQTGDYINLYTLTGICIFAMSLCFILNKSSRK